MKISCLVPAYNAEAFLGEAIESALGQSRAPDEIVVVDDGSTDGTADMAASYAGVRLVRQENGGIVAARNRCMAEATGELIAWLDADDIWMADHLERLEPLLGEHVIAFGDAVRLFPDGPETETYVDRSRFRQLFDVSDAEPTVIERNLYKAILPGLFIPNEAMLFRWKDGIRVGLYDPAQVTSSDRLFTLKLSLLGSAIFDPHVHVHARIHQTNTTGRHNFLPVSRLRQRALDRCEELVAPLNDPEDLRTIEALRGVEWKRIRRLTSKQGLRPYMQVRGWWRHPRDLGRALLGQRQNLKPRS